MAGLLEAYGPGVALLIICTKADKWRRKNSAESSSTSALKNYLEDLLERNENIFDIIQDTIEMGIKGSISFDDGYATIKCGEIKYSNSNILEAKDQISLQIEVIEFVIRDILPSSDIHLKKYGYIYLPERVVQTPTVAR